MTRFHRLPFVDAAPIATPRGPAPNIVDQLRQGLDGASLNQVVIRHSGEGMLFADLREGTAVLAECAGRGGQRLQAALSEAPGELSLHSMDPQSFADEAGRGRSMPLRPLLWNLGLLACSANRALAPLSSSSCIKLRRWPDFRVLAHRPDSFRMCALMIKAPMSVDACSQALALPSSQVQAFFNASYLSGYAMQVDAPSVRPSTAAKGRGVVALWRSVRTRWSA